MAEKRIEIGPEARALLDKLGIDEPATMVRSITIYPREVLVEIYLENEEGSKYVEQETGEPATDKRRILSAMDDFPSGP